MRLFDRSISKKSVQIMESFLSSVSQFGVSSVTHDITYGEGLITILSSDLRIPEYYYNKGFSAICTDETGRNLTSGIYAIINLVKYNFSEKKIFQKASKVFNFENSLHLSIILKIHSILLAFYFLNYQTLSFTTLF